MGNLRLYLKGKEVPDEAKKAIGGGRLKDMTNIKPMWRIKMLTEMFGPIGIGWNYKTENREFREGSDGVVAVFVDIALRYKEGGTWSEEIPGTGGSLFVAKEKGGLFTSDECVKMAATDAISVAAKSIGIGADVYFAEDKTKYDEQGEPFDEDKAWREADDAMWEKAKELGINFQIVQNGFKTKYKILAKDATIEQLKEVTENMRKPTKQATKLSDI